MSYKDRDKHLKYQEHYNKFKRLEVKINKEIEETEQRLMEVREKINKIKCLET